VNKKKQKNFICFCAGLVSAPREAEQKIFAEPPDAQSFFTKKRPLYFPFIIRGCQTRPAPTRESFKINALQRHNPK
jgi:hypothetical protein